MLFSAVLIFVSCLFLSINADPISCAIRDIQKEKVKGNLEEVKSGTLQEYFIGHDSLKRPGYITVEVRSADLDKGSDPTASALQWLKEVSVEGDQPVHIIAKKLGGPGTENNLLSRGKSVNVDEWKQHEDQVYTHLKESGDRHARLIFAMEYADEKPKSRTSVLYYFYALYKDGKVAEKLRGKIENVKSAEEGGKSGEKPGEKEGGSEGGSEDKNGEKTGEKTGEKEEGNEDKNGEKTGEQDAGSEDKTGEQDADKTGEKTGEKEADKTE